MTRSQLLVEDDVVGYIPTLSAPAKIFLVYRKFFAVALKIMPSLQLEKKNCVVRVRHCLPR